MGRLVACSAPNGLHVCPSQAQNCSLYTTASTCVAKQLAYSGPATVLNATTTFPVTLTTGDAQSFTSAFIAALSLRCILAENTLNMHSCAYLHAEELCASCTSTALRAVYVIVCCCECSQLMQTCRQADCERVPSHEVILCINTHGCLPICLPSPYPPPSGRNLDGVL